MNKRAYRNTVKSDLINRTEEFLLGGDKLEHNTEFFNHLKNNCKESRIKTAGRFPFALWSSSSFQLCIKTASTVKRNCSVFIHDLESE